MSRFKVGPSFCEFVVDCGPDAPQRYAGTPAQRKMRYEVRLDGRPLDAVTARFLAAALVAMAAEVDRINQKQ